ncbi:uncharacterized protein TNCV_1127541 [Trichonephila clavipes]|nr:uncharacterized protein TNCV_1127541 [Trichonephila clavipes]
MELIQLPLWIMLSLKILNWPCTADSIPELRSDHNPVNSTHEIDSEVRNLTSEILNADASASRPFYHSEQPYVQGELKELIKERNKARKTWQQTRHPQHKSDLNRLQNIIKRKIYHYRQQAWGDNLSTLNAEDNSLWGIAKAFRKKTSQISAFNGPTVVVVPILKPGKNSALAESYRPISLLPVLSKLAQRPPRKRKYPDYGAAQVSPSSLHFPPTSQSR